MMGTARHETAHAVREDGHLVEWDRPLGHQSFEDLRQRAPVGQDMQAGVVAQIGGRVGEIAASLAPW